MKEADALQEKDEEDEADTVPVESESYVNLKKRMARKHHLNVDSLLQENRKLCKEFQKKQVVTSWFVVSVVVSSSSSSSPTPC